MNKSQGPEEQGGPLWNGCRVGEQGNIVFKSHFFVILLFFFFLVSNFLPLPVLSC